MKTCKQSIHRLSCPFIPKRRMADFAQALTQVYCVVAGEEAGRRQGKESFSY